MDRIRHINPAELFGKVRNMFLPARPLGSSLVLTTLMLAVGAVAGCARAAEANQECFFAGYSARNIVGAQGGADIKVTRQAGGASWIIGKPELNELSPVVSPDGQQIAFIKRRLFDPYGSTDHLALEGVYVANINGSGERQITFPPDGFADWNPTWEGSGEELLLVRWRHANTIGALRTGGNGDVFRVNRDGSGLTQVTFGGGNTPPRPCIPS